MNRILFFLVLFFTLCNPLNIYSQGTGFANIKGKITDAVTGEVLAGATVIIGNTSIGTASNSDGDFLITNLKPGSYNVTFSYLGYINDTLKANLQPGQTLQLNTSLHSVNINLGEVVVSVQVKGQRAAINLVRSSNSIVNVVSSEKIRDVPDVNAAESIGRLPGVSLERVGGEGNRVIVDGLTPRFTIVEVDGVRLNGVDADRGVGLQSISSESLGGIELSKSLTADKDADAIGGIVNLTTKVADKGFHVDVMSTKGYNDLDNAYTNYKIAGNIGNRFFNDKLGVLVTLSKEQVIRSSDQVTLSSSASAINDTTVYFYKNNATVDEK